jgi:hypothetical protein
LGEGWGEGFERGLKINHYCNVKKCTVVKFNISKKATCHYGGVFYDEAISTVISGDCEAKKQVLLKKASQ